MSELVERLAKHLFVALGPGQHEQPGVTEEGNRLMRESWERNWYGMGADKQAFWHDLARAALQVLDIGEDAAPDGVGLARKALEAVSVHLCVHCGGTYPRCGPDTYCVHHGIQEEMEEALVALPPCQNPSEGIPTAPRVGVGQTETQETGGAQPRNCRYLLSMPDQGEEDVYCIHGGLVGVHCGDARPECAVYRLSDMGGR